MKRIEEMHLRYMAKLSGRTITRYDSWGGCSLGVACVDGMSSQAETNLMADILGLKSLKQVG